MSQHNMCILYNMVFAAELKTHRLPFLIISLGGWLLSNPQKGKQIRLAAWIQAAQEHTDVVKLKRD